MCGRFLIDEDVSSALDLMVPGWEQLSFAFKFGTIYPSMPCIVITKKDGRLSCAVMPFGYKSTSMNKLIINARAETASEKRMFAYAWRHARCAVPASLFYEWTPDKQKISFTQPDGRPMYLAALAIDEQFVILTRPADLSVSPYHHRMPVILEQDQVAPWIFDEARAHQLIENAAPVLNASGAFSQATLF